MKKITKSLLLLAALAISGCQNKYTYVETYNDSDYLSGRTITKTDEKKSIEADNDSLAYLEAFRSFSISLKVARDMKKEYKDYTKQPISFVLYNSKGVDISTGKSYPKVQDSIMSIVDGLGESISSKESPIKKPIVDSAVLVKLIAKFRMKKDEFSNDDLVWYYHRNTPSYTNVDGLYCYFAVVNGVAQNLRFRIQYTADDWLFFNNAIFSIDKIAYPYSPLEVKRDNGIGGIWEWTDESATNAELKTITLALSKCSSAKIRFQGDKYYQERVIAKQQIESIKETIYLYNMLGGNF